MILLALTLLAFGIGDLLRWSPNRVSRRRAATAAVGATAVTVAVTALAGWQPREIVGVALLEGTVVTVWLLFDAPAIDAFAAGWPLAWITLVLSTAFAASGSAPAVTGPLSHWYGNLPFAFARSIPIDQFLLGAAAGLFLTASANRVVRLVLEAAHTPVARGEATLSGGRLLGPMERLFVAAMVVSGDLTGAAIIIAAKGLLRLPEIRSSTEERDGAQDHVTEYFLIGTFFSLLIAGGLGALVLGSS